jgi:hypothetical protein
VRTGKSSAEWFGELEEYLRGEVGSGRYPHLAKFQHDDTIAYDLEANFAFGLECILDGIAARVPALRGPRKTAPDEPQSDGSTSK